MDKKKVIQSYKMAKNIKNKESITPNLPNSLDDSKCKKGHSYVKWHHDEGGNLVKAFWKCRNCNRELG